MAKLSLNLDALEVQSFETVEVPEEKGTVVGHLAPATPRCSADCTEDWSCGIWCPPTYDPAPTGPCAC